MGCGNAVGWLTDPLGQGVGDAIGFHGPGEEAFNSIFSPGSFLNNLKDDWTRLKHLLVADMRRDRETMVNGALTPRRIIYGTCRVSGQIAYVESAGDQNQFLHLVVILAGHAVTGFGAVTLDDKPIADFGGKAYHELFDGTQTTACQALIDASDGLWTADHKLLGCAYIYLKLEYDETLFPSGLPTVKVVVQGKKVLDPRTGSTVFSDNPALCAYDYMMLSEELGGMGCRPDEVEVAPVNTAATICDQLVVKNAAGNEYEKRYTCNGALSLDATPKVLLASILQSMGGIPDYSNGVWKLYAAGYLEPEADIDETWLNGAVTFRVGSNKSEKINTVTGTFIDPDDHWAAKGFPCITSSVYKAEDDGEELSQDLTLNFTTSGTMAQRLAKITLERSRRGQTIDYPCNFKAFRLSPTTVCRVNNTRLGWSNRITRITNWSFSGLGGVKLTLKEEDPAVYSWVPGDVIEVTTPPQTILPDPLLVFPPSNIVLLPVVYDTQQGALTRVDLLVSWTAGSVGPIRYELQYRLVGGDWSPARQTYDLSLRIEDLAEGNYEVRLQGINSIGAGSVWVTAAVYVPNADITVPDVTGLEIFRQGNDTEFIGRDIRLRWNRVAPRGVGDATGTAGPQQPATWFRYYELRVLDENGTLRRTEYLVTEQYTYTYEKNYDDGLGSATRDVQFELRAVSSWGDKSVHAALLSVSNPPPPAPGGIALLPFIKSFGIVFEPVNIPDVAGYLVHASQQAGFTPAANTLVNRGPDTRVLKTLTGGGTWYVRVAAFDTFGEDTLVYSAEYSVVVPDAQILPDDIYTGLRTDFLVRDSIFNFGDNGANPTAGTETTLYWTAGSIVRAGEVFTLDAANLANAAGKWVIATLTGGTATLSLADISAGIPALSPGQIIIAYTSAIANTAGNYICYVRQANSMQLEGANIRDLTVKDAAIQSLTADKITAGIIDALVVTIQNLIVGENVAMGENASIAWTNVTGAGKPADNATVGATWGTNLGGIPGTIMHTSTYIDGNNVFTGNVYAEKIFGSLIKGKMFTTAGTIQAVSAITGNWPNLTEIAVTDATDFPASGHASVYGDDPGISGTRWNGFSWTGKSGNVLTGITIDNTSAMSISTSNRWVIPDKQSDGSTNNRVMVQFKNTGDFHIYNSGACVYTYNGVMTSNYGMSSNHPSGDAYFGTSNASGGSGAYAGRFNSSYNSAVYGNGASGYYDFYAAGAGTNYGPFTGGHDGLIDKLVEVAIGDIVRDVRIVARRNVSNTIAQVEPSASLRQPALGVVAGRVEISLEQVPSALIDYDDMAALADVYDLVAVNAVGEGQINVCRDGGNIAAGDYICSSARPGKGQRQDDDLLHCYTVAKAREAVVWADGEDDIRMIACTYHAG